MNAEAPRFINGAALFDGWQDDVRHGKGPVPFPHTLPVPELSPGTVTLLGGAPGAGKTAFVMQVVVEALRHTDTLRALVANVEMAPRALLDRQLARLSGIPADVIRHRRIPAEHAEQLDDGLATVGSIAGRLAFLEPPFDLENVAAAADAHEADLLVLDYVQRFAMSGTEGDARAKLNATMDALRRFADSGAVVFALSAIGRSKDDRGRATYTGAGLASFRESSELEFGADDAFILAPVDDDSPDVVRLAHLKCRNGAQRTIDLHFDRPRQSFELLDDQPPKGSPGRRSRRKRKSASKVAPVPGGDGADPVWAAKLRALWESNNTHTRGDALLDLDARSEGGDA